jgi:hypothetical protein
VHVEPSADWYAPPLIALYWPLTHVPHVGSNTLRRNLPAGHGLVSHSVISSTFSVSLMVTFCTRHRPGLQARQVRLMVEFHTVSMARTLPEGQAYGSQRDDFVFVVVVWYVLMGQG